MNGPLGQSLRHIVDALQRNLFDELEGRTDPVAPLPVAPDEPPPTQAGAAPDPSRRAEPRRRLVVDGQELAFVFKRTRRRTIGFAVAADGLVVSAPRWVALREVDAAVRERSAWIFAKLAEQHERRTHDVATRTVWAHGATLDYLGAPVRIVLGGSHGLAPGDVRLDAVADIADAGVAVPADGGDDAADAAALVDVSAPRLLHVGLPHGAAEARVRDAVHAWLQGEARRIFAQRCAHFAPRLGVTVTRLSLSSARTRWGSANANGAIRLHWRLVQHALPTIDYVVAHELAHLREMNHGPRFWAVVRAVLPAYEEARQRLRKERVAGAGDVL